MSDRKGPENGALGGLPALPFENFEAQLEADAAPFKNKPQPIGGSRRGIPNKRSAQLRDVYLRMGLPHPVLAMGSLLRLGIDGLAKELHCDLVDAAELYRKIASDVAPYIEGKQPTRVDVTGIEGLPLVVVGDIASARQAIGEARAAGALAIDDEVEPALIEHEQNQRVSREASAKSHDAKSHGYDKPLKMQDNPASDR